MLVITSCSSKKRLAIAPGLSAHEIEAQTVQSFATKWTQRTEKAKEKRPAAEVYGGVGVHAARAAAEKMGARLYFISAGLSVVRARKNIPAYDLTVSAGGARPKPLKKANAEEWWKALNLALGRKDPLAAVIRRHNDLVLVALPERYLNMVQAELVKLTDVHRKRLRILIADGSPLHGDLEPQALRYDERLQYLSKAPKGALASFVQRALLHFCGLIDESRTIRSVKRQREMVEEALKKARIRKTPIRKKCTDLQITNWAKRTDPSRRKSRSTLLKMLRESGRACEQSRFFALMDAMK